MMKHNIAHKTLEQTFHNVFYFNRKNIRAQNSTTLIKIKWVKHHNSNIIFTLAIPADLFKSFFQRTTNVLKYIFVTF